MDHVQITVHPMATEVGGASPTYSPIFDVAPFSKLVCFLNVEAAYGTAPQLTVTVEESMNGQDWRTAGSVNATAIAIQKLSLSDLARFVKAKYSYTGTDPTFTFSFLGLAREF